MQLNNHLDKIDTLRDFAQHGSPVVSLITYEEIYDMENPNVQEIAKTYSSLSGIYDDKTIDGFENGKLALLESKAWMTYWLRDKYTNK